MTAATQRLIVLCLLSFPLRAAADDWPQWLGPQRDGVWRETGIVEKFPQGGPKVRWRVPIGGGYSGPAVAGGKVFVLDRQLGDGARNPQSGFSRGRLTGSERVLCLNEADGKQLWKFEYDCPYNIQYPVGPRCSPVIHEGKVYALGAMGHLHCLDAASGKLLWSKDLAAIYNVQVPVWGFAGHPLIDGKKLICLVGGDGATVVAFDKDTGKELWKALDAREPGYAPPMIYTFGDKRQLIMWDPQAVNSLDPETGTVYWSQPFESRAGLSIPTPRKVGDNLFITAFYNGSLMLKVTGDKPSAEVVWKAAGRSERNTEGLHAIMCTPFIKDGYIYGVCSYGQLRCLKADTGERVWETLKPTTGGEPVRWANAFIVAQGDRYFLFNEKGDLIIAKLTPKGYEEIDRANLLEPTTKDAGRDYLWTHPAFANKCVYARNDKEIVCVSLAAE